VALTNDESSDRGDSADPRAIPRQTRVGEDPAAMAAVLRREWETVREIGLGACVGIAGPDGLGEAASSRVLDGLGKRLLSLLRPYDGIHRYGADRFLIILPRLAETHAPSVLDRLRQAVAAKPVPSTGGVLRPVTVSIGGAMMLGEVSAHEVVQRADRALESMIRRGDSGIRLWVPEIDVNWPGL